MLLTTVHHFLFDFVEALMMLLELFGAIVIAYGAIVVFVRFFFLKYSEPSTDIRIRLARTLSLGLEFYLAAEIFKTVTTTEPRDLMAIGVIVVLRTVMAILIHWEMKHDMESLKEEHELDRELTHKLPAVTTNGEHQSVAQRA